MLIFLPPNGVATVNLKFTRNRPTKSVISIKKNKHPICHITTAEVVNTATRNMTICY